MAHHQFMAQFSIVQINVLKLFPSVLFATFLSFVESLVYGPVSMTPFCHHFVTIYDETTEIMQRRQWQSIDQGILQWDQKGNCCH